MSGLKMATKRKTTTPDMGSDSSDVSTGDESSRKLVIPDTNLEFSGAEFEKRVKNMRPEEDSDSDDSNYKRPDLNGDVEKLFNKTYTAEDFVKKQRLPHPDELNTRTTRSKAAQSLKPENESSDAPSKRRSSNHKNNPKQPRLSVEGKTSTSSSNISKSRTRTSSKESKQLTPAMKKQYVTGESASSTKSINDDSALVGMEPTKTSKKGDTSSKSSVTSATHSENHLPLKPKFNVLHSTPIDAHKSSAFPDAYKLTPIATQTRSEMFTVPRPVAKRNSTDKKIESEVAASSDVLDFESSANPSDAASFWDFKRKSITNWIQGSQQNIVKNVDTVYEDFDQIEEVPSSLRPSTSRTSKSNSRTSKVPAPVEFGTFVKAASKGETALSLNQNTISHKRPNETITIEKPVNEPKETDIVNNGDSTYVELSNLSSSTNGSKSVTKSVNQLDSPSVNSKGLVFARKSLPVIVETPVNDYEIIQEQDIIIGAEVTLTDDIEMFPKELDTSTEKAKSKTFTSEGTRIPVEKEDGTSKQDKSASRTSLKSIRSKRDTSKHEQRKSAKTQDTISPSTLEVSKSQQDKFRQNEMSSGKHDTPQEEINSENHNTLPEEIFSAKPDTPAKETFSGEQSIPPKEMSSRKSDTPPEEMSSIKSDTLPEEMSSKQTDIPPEEMSSKQSDTPSEEMFSKQTDTPQKEISSRKTNTRPKETSSRKLDALFLTPEEIFSGNSDTPAEEIFSGKSDTPPEETSCRKRDKSPPRPDVSKSAHLESTKQSKNKKSMSSMKGKEVTLVSDSDIIEVSSGDDTSESDEKSKMNKRSFNFSKHTASPYVRAGLSRSIKQEVSKSIQKLPSNQSGIRSSTRKLNNNYEQLYSDVEILPSSESEMESESDDYDELTDSDSEIGQMSTKDSNVTSTIRQDASSVSKEMFSKESEREEHSENEPDKSTIPDASHSRNINQELVNSEVEVVSSDEGQEIAPASDENQEAASASDENQETASTSDENQETASASDEVIPESDEIPQKNQKLSTSADKNRLAAKNGQSSSTIKLQMTKGELEKLAVEQDGSKNKQEEIVSTQSNLMSQKEIEEMYEEMLKGGQRVRTESNEREHEIVTTSEESASDNAETPASVEKPVTNSKKPSTRKINSSRQQEKIEHDNSIRKSRLTTEKDSSPNRSVSHSLRQRAKLQHAKSESNRRKSTRSMSRVEKEIPEESSEGDVENPSSPTKSVVNISKLYNGKANKLRQNEELQSPNKNRKSLRPQEKIEPVNSASKTRKSIMSLEIDDSRNQRVRSSSRQQAKLQQNLTPVKENSAIYNVSPSLRQRAKLQHERSVNSLRKSTPRTVNEASESTDSEQIPVIQSKALTNGSKIPTGKVITPRESVSSIEKTKSPNKKGNSSRQLEKVQHQNATKKHMESNLRSEESISSADEEMVKDKPLTIGSKSPTDIMNSLPQNVTTYKLRKTQIQKRNSSIQQKQTKNENSKSNLGKSTKPLPSSKRGTSEESPLKDDEEVVQFSSPEKSSKNTPKLSPGKLNRSHQNVSKSGQINSQNRGGKSISTKEMQSNSKSNLRKSLKPKALPEKDTSEELSEFESDEMEEIPITKLKSLTNGSKVSLDKANLQNVSLSKERKYSNKKENVARQILTYTPAKSSVQNQRVSSPALKGKVQQEISKSKRPLPTSSSDDGNDKNQRTSTKKEKRQQVISSRKARHLSPSSEESSPQNPGVRTSSRQRERSNRNLDVSTTNQEEYLITKQQMASSYLNARKSAGKSIQGNSPKKPAALEKSTLSVDSEFELDEVVSVSQRPKGKHNSSQSTKLKSQAVQRLVDHISRTVESPVSDNIQPSSSRFRTRKRAGSRAPGSSASQSSINPSEIYGDFLVSRSRSQDSSLASKANFTSSILPGTSKTKEIMKSVIEEDSAPSPILPTRDLGNKEESPPPSPIEASAATGNVPMSKEEIRKKFNEDLKRLGFWDPPVRTEPIIEKSKLQRCALIWGRLDLKDDEVEFLHKKFNEEALRIMNGLCANATYPGGIFTYKEIKESLVKEGLIEDIAAEPHRTMFQTWTTQQQQEAKSIGLMPLSKSDDPSIYKLGLLKELTEN